ncbi:MAG TPA: DUF6295 family protein [Acidimicrobiales bacterium]|nr:DUF6295 family protein [Acidimicrobiales bacterium]
MCTYQTELFDVRASAKTAEGWAPMTRAMVYVDHPIHLAAGHALMIDFLNPSGGPSARAALEMDAHSARALARAILTSLDSVPEGLLSDLAS